MPGVKNQHYVPRFYLKSFTDDSGYLSVVRRDAGGLKPVFRTRPENVCAETTSMRSGDVDPRAMTDSSRRASSKMLLGKSRTILHLPTDRCSLFLIPENCQKVKSASR